jgi:superkiller protein 3
LKRLIALSPDNGDLHNDLGGLYVSGQMTEAAISEFQAAIRADPELTAARHNLAVLLAGQGHYTEAIAQWQTILELEPGNGLVHGFLADALRLTGDRAGAIAHYRAAIASGYKNPQWETNLIWLVATDAATTPEQAEELLPLAKQAAAQSADAHTFDALAALLARTGRYDDAVVAAQAAIDRVRLSNPAVVPEIQRRLAAYRSGRAYLEK